jgi:hypothetical protein
MKAVVLTSEFWNKNKTLRNPVEIKFKKGSIKRGCLQAVAIMQLLAL